MRVLRLCLALILASLVLHAGAQEPASGGPTPGPDAPGMTLKTTVRRVVLDVIVTDSKDNPVRGLTRGDFTVTEDGDPQRVLSFESNGFDEAMDYIPPKLPPEPPNTFVNLPATPEKGPLYVLLYDLVNMDNEDQMAQTVNQHPDQIRGRQQLIKFIQSKPEGARFAIFVRSDGLFLLQGFTSDKSQLYAAIDPHSPRPHIPQVFLMGQNMGRGDPNSALQVLQRIAAYLDGMPGRKNLIWFSGGFPLALFPGKDDGPRHVEEVKSTLNLLTQDQIAIYPVDVRGVVYSDAHSTPGLADDRAPVSQRQAGASGSSSVTQGNSNQPGHPPGASAHGEGTAQGVSLLRSSYFAEDTIAEQTGGRAFYSDNDVAGELTSATEAGEAYYTLTYSPTNRNYDGSLRSIKVTLARKGYQLAYRRSYYATDTGDPATTSLLRSSTPLITAARRRDNDALVVYMKHGAPAAYQLLFAAHLRALGAPAKATPEQLARLAAQPAYAKISQRQLQSTTLQTFAIDYTLTAHQFRLGGTTAPLKLEVAAAAYDSEGRLLNAIVDEATPDANTTPSKTFRVEQTLDAPAAATSIRLAIKDANTGRVGAMEINLPLPPEPEPDSHASSGAQPAPAPSN